jgi:hypothetical protein
VTLDGSACATQGCAGDLRRLGYAALLHRLRVWSEHPVYAPGFERDLEQPIAAAVTVPPEPRWW